MNRRGRPDAARPPTLLVLRTNTKADLDVAKKYFDIISGDWFSSRDSGIGALGELGALHPTLVVVEMEIPLVSCSLVVLHGNA